MLAVVHTVQVQLSVPEFTATHVIPYLLDIPWCGQWNVQRLESEYWLGSNVGCYGKSLWIITPILSWGTTPQDLRRSLIFSLPIVRKILWQLFFESLSSSYRGMLLNKCRPAGLLAQEHPDWVKPSRHMITSLVVYSSINCSQDQ